MRSSGENLVFIVGHYKSGSTWLVNMLSLHPSIRAVRETQLFRYAFGPVDFRQNVAKLVRDPSWAEGGIRNLPRNRLAKLTRPIRRRGQATLRWTERPTTLLDLALRDQMRLRGLLRASTSREDFCQRFYSFLLRALKPPDYLVDKSVTSLNHIENIKNVFPACKLMAIYRDGRDVVLSDKFHLQNQYKKTQDFSSSVDNWRRAMQTQLESQRREEMLTLSYESLLSAGELELRRILRFLDLPSSDGIVRDMLRRSSFEFVTGRPLGQENADSFYRKGGTGDWANRFSEADMQEFSEIAGELLVTLGYEEEADWRTWSRKRSPGV